MMQTYDKYMTCDECSEMTLIHDPCDGLVCGKCGLVKNPFVFAEEMVQDPELHCAVKECDTFQSVNPRVQSIAEMETIGCCIGISDSTVHAATMEYNRHSSNLKGDHHKKAMMAACLYLTAGKARLESQDVYARLFGVDSKMVNTMVNRIYNEKVPLNMTSPQQISIETNFWTLIDKCLTFPTSCKKKVKEACVSLYNHLKSKDPKFRNKRPEFALSAVLYYVLMELNFSEKMEWDQVYFYKMIGISMETLKIHKKDIMKMISRLKIHKEDIMKMISRPVL